MDRARWDRIQTLFHEALERPESERRTHVENRARGDHDLVADVLRMLEEDAGGRSLLDRGVQGAASGLLGAPEETPRAIGRYRLLDVLGEGGMGVVYLAERPDLGNRLAIKVLRDAWLSPARRHRFAEEQRLLARLTHPNIARLYDAGWLPDGTPWFAMEYVDGMPLTRYCRRNATSIPGRLQLFRSVCEAVLYAHRHAVIHRDIKPSNILVKADGTIRLLDFGVAKQLESMDDPRDATRTALRMMTPAYASPEQIRGESVGIHTDVYSLGVVLYELLTGALPFDLERLTPAEASDVLARQAPPPPAAAARRLAAALPPGRRPASSWSDLDVLCLTAMHRDVSRRYGSVEALIRDIDRFLAGEPLEAHRDTVRYRLRKFVSRHRRAVAVGVVVAIAVLSLSVFYTVRLAVARNQALAEAEKARRIQAFMLNLFSGGDEEAGPAEDLRVVTLLDRGMREARLLDGEPEVQTELYLTLGRIYEQLGELDQAGDVFRAALDLSRSRLGNDHPALVESLLALGQLHLAAARHDDAEPLIREAMGRVARLGSADRLMEATVVGALGRLHEERGDYDRAIVLLEQAVDLLSSPATSERDLARALSQLANANFYAGRYDESTALNRRALEIDRRLWGDRHPMVADDLINLGAIEFNRGRYAAAERLDREAFDIFRAWYGSEHPETASAMTILGRALLYLDRPDEAEPLLRDALSVQERVYGEHPRVASALNDLSGVLMQRGELDEAERLTRRQIGIYRAVYGERHPLVAIGLANLASIDLLRERFISAESILRDVIERFTEAYSAEDMNTAIARIKLGRALLRQGVFAEAVQESRAGHDLLADRTDPAVSWLRAARRDLVEAYEALGLPDEAARYRPPEGDADL